MNDEGLADVAAANPFRLPRNHPGIGGDRRTLLRRTPTVPRQPAVGCSTGVKPLASALTDVGGVSTSTTSVTVRASGRVQPRKENASMRSASTSRAWPSAPMITVPSGSDSRSACQVLRSRPRSIPLPRRRRSVVRRRSSSTARSAGSTASRYERYMSRRHVAQGRCPAASATASSRKKSGVQRLGRASGTRQSRNSVKQVIHSVELRWWRTTCSRSSTMQPRLPVNRPRALTACRSPHGSTRLRRGITPSCQPATSVHLVVVAIARCADTISNAGAAPCGVARPRPPPSRWPPLGLVRPRYLGRYIPSGQPPGGGLSLAVQHPPRNYPGGCSQREPKRPKATYALDLRGLPGLHGLERPHEHLVEPERVGAVLPPDVVGIHDVAPPFDIRSLSSPRIVPQRASISRWS